MLFKIGGLGRESFQILNQYRKHFSDRTKIISDDSHSIQTFVSENGFESDVIPSGTYVSPNGNTVSSVNELHAEEKESNQTEAWSQYKTSAGISGLDCIQEEAEIYTGHEKVEA